MCIRVEATSLCSLEANHICSLYLCADRASRVYPELKVKYNDHLHADPNRQQNQSLYSNQRRPGELQFRQRMREIVIACERVPCGSCWTRARLTAFHVEAVWHFYKTYFFFQCFDVTIIKHYLCMYVCVYIRCASRTFPWGGGGSGADPEYIYIVSLILYIMLQKSCHMYNITLSATAFIYTQI
jgi:hypothetical protein